MAAHLRIGPFQGRDDAGAEMGDQLAVQFFQLARRKAAGKDGAAATILQALDDGQDHVLHLFLALEEMHVFQQEHVQIAQAGAEALHIVAAQGRHIARGQILGGKIGQTGLTALLLHGTAHGLHDVGLAQAGSRADEQGLHTAAVMADVLGRSHGHGIAGADHEIVETEAPALTGAGAQRGGRQGQGTLAGLPERLGRTGRRRMEGRRGHLMHRLRHRRGKRGRSSGGRSNGRGRSDSSPLTGDADVDVFRRHLQHGRGSGAQGILHAVAQPAGHVFAGCGKTQAVPFDMGIQRMDPHLEDAGIEDTPQIFRDLLPLLLHACHCPPIKNAGTRAMASHARSNMSRPVGLLRCRRPSFGEAPARM